MAEFQPIPAWPQFQDLTGQTFSRLTVLGYLGKQGTGYFWLCRCRCGTVKRVRGSSLRMGRTTSCGCWRDEKCGMAGRKSAVLRRKYTNEYRLDGDDVFLAIRTKAGDEIVTAVIDAADLELVKSRYWVFDAHAGYVRGYRKVDELAKVPNDPERISLHQLIVGKQVDHKDRNRLNNRRANLRPASQSQNGANTGKYNRAFVASRFKGVTRSGRRKWQSRIRVDWKLIHLGTYEGEEEAARAYDEAAQKYFGEFACLNFPGETR